MDKQFAWLLARTWWWNKAQAVGLFVVVATAGVLAFSNVSRWYLIAWISFLVINVLLAWGVRSERIPPAALFGHFAVATILMVTFAPGGTIWSRGVALLVMATYYFCVMVPGYGLVTLLFGYEAMAEVEHTRLDGSPRFYRRATVLVNRAYCYRQGVAMYMHDYFGRRVGKQKMRELRTR